MPLDLKLTLLSFVLVFTNPVNALDNLSIEINNIINPSWQIDNARLTLDDLQKSPQQLGLTIDKLTLPKPFSDLQIVNVKCHQFSWQDNQIDCTHGKAAIKSKQFNSPRFSFSFSLTEQKSWFSIKNLKLAKGSISLIAKEKGQDWAVSITTKNLSLKTLSRYFPKAKVDVDKGRVNANINITGTSDHVSRYLIKALFKQMTLQANQGKLATDSVNLQWNLQAKFKQGQWQWENTAHLKQGELYLEPVYLSIKEKALTLNTKGNKSAKGQLQLKNIHFIHPDVIDLTANGLIRDLSEFKIEKANISAEIKHLNDFSKQYISPFIEQTAFEGFNLAGQINLQANISKFNLIDFSIGLGQLNITDDNNRFGIKTATGNINWSNNALFAKASTINWEQIKIRAIPINASSLNFLFKNKQITLLEQASIPLLDGYFLIKDFKWQKTDEDEPKVYLEGAVQQLSLEKLSYALDWTPLTGYISGIIPGVNYENKTLTLQGQLLASLFGGQVKINNLTSSGLFTDFSKFSMDMQIDNLDLYQLTQKFKMGVMEGKVSGFVNNLYLENWQPNSFYAWLGTPKNDDSRHRISQKAVENIASIGGGGAADIISKGFLRFFDTFNYDRLGFGCYLHNGVCQLMGIEAAEQGYYLVKGGGIPRIDIMGYNTEVDWNVLMERLSRISDTDEVLIE